MSLGNLDPASDRVSPGADDWLIVLHEGAVGPGMLSYSLACKVCKYKQL